MTHKFTLLERITNILLLNASFIDNLGLMHGKMGICIFFYHLARKTNNKIYEDYAGELLDEITEEINEQTPWDFENGLAGIGWGIEYLVQKGFVEGDTDEILLEFDNKLFRQLNFAVPHELGLLNGTLGICAYFLKRTKKLEFDKGKIPLLTNMHILIQCIDEVERNWIRKKAFVSNPGTKVEPTIIKENGLTDKSIIRDLAINCTMAPSSRMFMIREKYEQELGSEIPLDLPFMLLLLEELYKLDLYNVKVFKLIGHVFKTLSGNEFNLQNTLDEDMLIFLKECLVKMNAEIDEIGNSGEIPDITDIKNFHNNLNNSINARRYELNNKLKLGRNLLSHQDWIESGLLINYNFKEKIGPKYDYSGRDIDNFNTIITHLISDYRNFSSLLGINPGLSGMGLRIIFNDVSDD